MPQADKSFRAFLDYQRFRLSIRISSRTVLPPYKGSVFRGAFGNAFRRAVCADRSGECASCALGDRCIYKAHFEPSCPRQFDDAGKFSRPPTPYVIVPPLTDRCFFEPGDALRFELVLMGDAVRALPYFIYAFMEMGRCGIGKGRGKYNLLSVDLMGNGNPLPIFDGARGTLREFSPETPVVSQPEDEALDAVSLHLLTPLRIKVKSDLVTELTFPLLFERLSARLRLLAAFYGDDSRLPDFSTLLALSRNIRVTEYALHWHEWERYSGRQKTTMKFGGLKGKVGFSGPMGPFMPYLRLAEHLSVGQQTTFGLGRIRVVA